MAGATRRPERPRFDLRIGLWQAEAAQVVRPDLLDEILTHLQAGAKDLYIMILFHEYFYHLNSFFLIF